MNLEDQVCSIELSKRLKELSVKQESLFYRFQEKGYQYIFCKYYEQYSPHIDLDIKDGYSAFTVAELGEMLPNVIHIDKDFSNEQYFISMDCDKHVYYSNITNSSEIHVADDDDNEANARAKMLIYLIENGLIKND